MHLRKHNRPSKYISKVYGGRLEEMDFLICHKMEIIGKQH